MSDSLLFWGWIVIVEIMLLYGLNSLLYPPQSHVKRYIPYFPCMVILFILSVTGYASGDYYNYIQVLEQMRAWTILPFIEEIYWILGLYINYDNELFRGIIFFIIYLFLFIIIARYSCDKNLTLSLYIIIFFLSVVSLLRSTLCDVVFFLAVFPFYSKRSINRFIFVIIATGVAWLFHHTAFILLIPFSLSLIIFPKSVYKLSLYLFPIFVVISFVVTKFIFSNYFDDSVYMGNDNSDGSRSAIITLFLTYIYWIILLSLCYYQCNYYLTHKSFNGYLVRIAFWFGYLTLILMLNPASHYLYVRVLAHGTLPLLLVLAIMMKEASKSVRKISMIVIGYGIIRYQFSFYLLYIYFKRLLSLNQYIS